MGKVLTDAQVEQFHRDGFLHPVTVMTPEDALSSRRALEAAETRYGSIHYIVKPHLVLTAADALAHNAVLLDAVEDLLGPDLMLWDSAYIIKEPQTEKFVSWHQDLTYWGLSSTDVVSIWLALSPATVASGCMKMIPGSHTEGQLQHGEDKSDNNVLSRGQTVVLDDTMQAPVECALQPGQMSIHHGWVLHASGPNQSGDRRIGFNMNIINPSVRQTRMENDSAMLLRGQDRYGHFRAEPRATADFSPDGKALQAEISRLRGKEINVGADGRLAAVRAG